MSHTLKCPICHKNASEPINLRCEHHPCFNCIQPYLTHQNTKSSLEQKYKIVCPACNKKTVLYDLRHLIVCGHQDEGNFVSDRFIGTKAQVKVQAGFIRYDSNYLSSQSGNHTRRGSIQSIANNKLIFQVKCSEHGQPYKYFCCDCQKNGRNCLLCSECAKPHYGQGHKLLSLSQAESRLFNLNTRSKQQISYFQKDLTYITNYLNQNKKVLSEYYFKLQDNLSQQFKNIYQKLQTKYNSLKQQLKKSHSQELKQITSKLQKITNHQNILQSLKQIDLKNLQTNTKFYQTYQKVNFNSIKNINVQINFQELVHLEKQNTIGSLDHFIVLRKGHQSHQNGLGTKNKKQNNLQNQYSHRSTRDKQNYKVGLSPSHSKRHSNHKKMLA